MLDSPIDEIKSKLTIEEVISGYVQLQRAGRNMKACCPFHNEKTPSFMVSSERQFWHCFGCNEGGDIFTFVMKMEGLDFKDALKMLAERAGVKLKSVNYAGSGKKSKILEILEMSRKFYEECLKIKSGKKANEYLLERGLSTGSIDKFQLGYAPDSWDLLSNFLGKKGFKEAEIFDAGMTVKKDRGGFYDRFRGRIMFPINNISGQTVGFSSRVMPGQDESQAKYINTPDTLVYNKSNILYGLDKAKIKIKSEDLCIMVEGNMDTIASVQAGVENAVATSGTALTSQQLRIIKRYTDNIAFAFDVDPAGIKAASRGIDLALGEGMNVLVIQVPEGKDPADCVKSDPELWRSAVKNPKKIMEFYFDSIFAKHDASGVDGKKKIAEELLGIIGRISNKIEQVHYLQMLSEKLNVEEKVLREVLDNAKKNDPKFSHKQRGSAGGDADIMNPDSREKQLQERLLGFIILYPQFFSEIFCELEELFSDEEFERIYLPMKELYSRNKCLTLNDLKKLKDLIAGQGFENKDSGERADGFVWDTAALRAETEIEHLDGDINKEISATIINLKRTKLQKDIKKLGNDIKIASKAKDPKDLETLLAEHDKCMKDLNELDSIS